MEKIELTKEDTESSSTTEVLQKTSNPESETRENEKWGNDDSYLPKGTLSLVGAIANLANSIIGSTVLSLPESNKESGIIGTLFFNFMLFIATSYSLYVIIEGATIFKTASLNRLFIVISGRIGVSVNVFIVAFMASAACIAYYVIMADSLIGVIQYLGLKMEKYDDRTSFACGVMQNPYFVKFIFFMLTFVFLIPSKIAELTIVSIISVCAVFVLFMCITILAIKDLSSPETRKVGLNTVRMFNTKTPMEMLNTISVYSQAYICQFNVIPIRNEMVDRSKKTLVYFCAISSLIGFIVYEFLGLIGYLQFGETILGNITLNYGENFLHHLARFSSLTIVFLTFPVVFFAARKIVHTFIYSPHVSMSIFTKKGFSTFLPLYGMTVILALVAKSLSKILTLTGSLFGPFISFNMPAIIKIFSELKLEQLKKEKVDITNFETFQSALNNLPTPRFRFKKKMIPFYLLFSIGTIITIFAATSSIKKFISEDTPFKIVFKPLSCGVSYRYKHLMSSLREIEIRCNANTIENLLEDKNSSGKGSNECSSEKGTEKYKCGTVIKDFAKVLNNNYSVKASIPSIAFSKKITDENKDKVIKTFYNLLNNYLSVIAEKPEMSKQCLLYDEISKISTMITPKEKTPVFGKLEKAILKSNCNNVLDFNKITDKKNDELNKLFICLNDDDTKVSSLNA